MLRNIVSSASATRRSFWFPTGMNPFVLFLDMLQKQGRPIHG
ncbi:hypothetical protein LINGRAHAP2_LOCUS24581 [Linum grandiflorum]